MPFVSKHLYLSCPMFIPKVLTASFVDFIFSMLLQGFFRGPRSMHSDLAILSFRPATSKKLFINETTFFTYSKSLSIFVESSACCTIFIFLSLIILKPCISYEL